MVNDFSIKKEDTEDGRVLAIITYNCVKTYDEDGPTSATRCDTKMIIRKNGTIVDTVRILPDANGMIEYWSGDSGEKAYDTLSTYTSDFKEIIDTLEIYIKFIEQTLAAYNQMDQLINKKMEENASIEAF